MSAALARLRKLIGDPILVREANAMVPTARALELAPSLREALALIDQALEPVHTFAPSGLRRRFALAATDHAALTLVPRLIEAIAAAAPEVDLSVRSLNQARVRAELASGELDLALGYFGPARGEVRQQLVRTERFVCVVRADHPGVGATLDLETYLRLPHLLVAPSGTPGSMVDELLRARGASRRVALSVPYALLAPLLVARGDYVVTLFESVARLASGWLALRVLDPPLELPQAVVAQAWHERQHRDAAHRWLRGLVVAAGRDV